MVLSGKTTACSALTFQRLSPSTCTDSRATLPPSRTRVKTKRKWSQENSILEQAILWGWGTDRVAPHWPQTPYVAVDSFEHLILHLPPECYIITDIQHHAHLSNCFVSTVCRPETTLGIISPECYPPYFWERISKWPGILHFGWLDSDLVMVLQVWTIVPGFLK